VATPLNQKLQISGRTVFEHGALIIGGYSGELLPIQSFNHSQQLPQSTPTELILSEQLQASQQIIKHGYIRKIKHCLNSFLTDY